MLLETFRSYEINTVLEFGAAKLKNIPFILQQNKTVCAVEFEKLIKNTLTKKNIKKCKRYGSKYQNVVFPYPFLSDTKKFDLILLINVPPIMPVFAERMFLLNLLYDKIKNNKYLLWLAQREGSYKEIREKGDQKCGDGIWMGKGRRFKTFYRYHPVEELDEIMSLYGFKLIKKGFDVPDVARLYQKTEHNLFSDMLTPEKIKGNIPVDKKIKESINFKIVKRTPRINPIVPNPKALSIENLYIEKIKSIPTGTEFAETYHRIVSHAMSRIFRNSLKNMDIKVKVDSGIKIIDTVFTNSAQNGFFSDLKSKTDCLHPMIEVKNISEDPTNPDFDQLSGRLNQAHGHFGILICRKVDDEKTVISRCKGYLLSGNYILFLTEDDICELLEYSRDNNQDEINTLMDKKLKDVIF